MTAPAVHLAGSKPEAGCATCGTQATVQLHPHHGRQCPEHVTLPPGPFRADLAADMVDLGRADAAFSYLRAWLHREATRRFGVAIAVRARRCWCGRPIHAPQAVECAEHDVGQSSTHEGAPPQ